MAHDPPILPYADVTTPAGVEGVQVIIVHPDVRRIVVSPKRRLDAPWAPASVAFEVTPFALRKATTGPFGVSRAVWPRSAVLDVRMASLSDRLVIRLAGQGPLEVDLGPDRAATELVMHELINALTVVAPAPPHLQTVADQPDDGLPPSVSRSTLLAVAGGLAALAALVSLLTPAGCFLFLLVPVPLGIALGTRRPGPWT